MALHATDPADRADQLLTLTQRLTDLLERETALYQARRPTEVAPFRDEKARLANIYRQECQRIANEPSLISGAPEDVRAKLATATDAFNVALEANIASVHALKTINEGLIKAVADHVADMRVAQAGYGPKATLKKSPDSHSALTLNQVA